MRTFLFILTLLALGFFSQGQTANLSIKITNIENAKGNMNIALFNSSEGFPSGPEHFIGEVVPVKTADFVYVLKDIPLGVYAISIFHDINEDGELDTNWIGMPKEPIGFSNNAKGKMGPPKFEDAKFELTKDMELSIELKQL